MPDYIKGVVNLRGKVIPVMDVRRRFNLPPRDYDPRTCIVVVNINETTTGLVVDEVSEVVDIPALQVEPAPRASRGNGHGYIQGMGKIGSGVKILLAVERLLFDNDFNLAATAAS